MRKHLYQRRMRYRRYLNNLPVTDHTGVCYPPSITVAYAHHMSKGGIPLMTRRQWKAHW